MHPDIEHSYTSEARALRESGGHSAAAALLREAMVRFPDRRNPLTEYAWRAQVARDWPEAIAHWAAVYGARFPLEAVRAAFADREDGYLDGIEALENAGVAADAERLREEYRACHWG